MMRATRAVAALKPAGSVRGRIYAGFGLLVVLLVLLACLAAVLVVRREQATDEADLHTDAAFYLEDARSQGNALYITLLTYTITGDEDRLATLEGLARRSTESLETARALLEEAGDNEQLAALDGFLSESNGFWQEIGRFSEPGTRPSPEELVATGDSLTGVAAAFDGLAQTERAHATKLEADAHRDGNVALIVIVVAGTIGSLLAGSASVVIARSILRRLGELEGAAHRVVPATWTPGPRYRAQASSPAWAVC